MASQLFAPLTVRPVTFHNRVFVSPMCQYSSQDGMPNDWHFVHLGSRAVGGASLVSVEASAVTPEGRITPWDAGIWSAAHAVAWKRAADFIRAHGAVPAIQLAHAGRKASCSKPWLGGKPLSPATACCRDRKSTRLNSSHQIISYAVFCLKKKKNTNSLRNIDCYSFGQTESSNSKSFSSWAALSFTFSCQDRWNTATPSV